MSDLGSDGVKVFVSDDDGYLAWLTAHPTGYVLNSEREPRAGYLWLHRATCEWFDPKRYKPGAFTCRQYIKICAEQVEPLKAWIGRLSASDFTRLCGSCHPDVAALDLAEVHRLALAQEVSRLRDDPRALADALKAPTEPPSFVLTQTKVYRRSAAVVAYVLLRAKGCCEACGAAAPFAKASDGEPYLEVHHKLPLAQGGVDHFKNAEALCPNCHRKRHFG